MPFQTFSFPVFKPFFLCAGAYKKLHFHLLKFAHANDELARNYLIAESLAYLRYPERNFHPARFLHIKVIYKYALRSFWTQVNNISIISHSTHLRTEHQVKLTNVRPVAGTANRVGYFMLYDQFFQARQVVIFQCLIHFHLQLFSFIGLAILVVAVYLIFQ